MNGLLAFALRSMVTIAISVGLASLGAPDSWAQQKTKLSYKRPPDMSDYTKQYRIDVGDVPGHQIRIYELKGTYPKGFLSIAGVGVGDEYSRGYSDYVDNNGRHWGYCEFDMENGDKIFCRVEGSSQKTTNPDGSKRSTYSGISTLTGGTGKFMGIRGYLRYSGVFDPLANLNEEQDDGEYWFEQ